MKNSLDCKKLLSYGKELSIFAGILLVLLFMFSCNNILMRNSGSLIIALPGARATTASLFTIELTGSNGTIPSEPLAGGTTVQFDDLAPDTYTINVKGMDDAGTIVLSGTAKATVTAGETETVTVDLQSSLGNLTVSFKGAESDSVAKYTVILSGPNESKKTQKVESRSVSFEGLIPGDYTVSVLGQDSAGTIVLSGTAKATVVAGETETVTVDLQSSLGNLTVSFEGAESDSVAEYTVILSGPNESKETQEVTDRTVQFEGLIPGDYTVSVLGQDSAGTIVLSGTAKATVVEGQTVPATVPLQDKLGKLSVEFTVPDGSTATSYTVEITGANSVTQSKPVSDGTSVLFEGLIPGLYSIRVEVKNTADDTGTIVLSGTAEATVVEGQTVPATVPLQEEVGRLSVTLTVPDGSIAQSYTVEITHSEDKEFSKEETISDGTSVLFNDLIPGSYTISVQGMNADTVVLYGTTTSDEVAKGEESSATVNLTGVVNDLTALKAAIPNGGIIYVGSDISIDATITESPLTPVTIQAAYKDVTLSGTGTTSTPMFQPTSGDWTFGGGEYTITLSGGSSNNSIFTISGSAATPKVTLTTNGIIKSSTNYESAVIISDDSAANNGIFCLDGGSITGRAAQSINVYANGQFIMESGFIESSAEKVVYMYGGTFSMTGGNIHNSSTDANSSSVFVNNGSFTFEGGTISKGVVVSKSDLFTISGSATVDTIKLNTYGLYFTVGGKLDGNSTVATIIINNSYQDGDTILKAADGVDLTAEVGKFKVTHESNGTQWKVVADGTTTGVLQQVQ